MEEKTLRANNLPNCVLFLTIFKQVWSSNISTLHLFSNFAYLKFLLYPLFSGNIPLSFLGHTSPYTDEPCEVWTTVWLDPNCILSGGEDNLLKLWDLRSDTKQPVNVNKTHKCGVISLHRESSDYIISGAYDDHLRRIDLRNFVQCILDKKVYF